MQTDTKEVVMPTINVEKTDTIKDIAEKIGIEYSSQMKNTVPPKSTAETALAAVYAAIEQQAGYQDANLEGLAALVTALTPRQPIASSGTVHVSSAAGLIKGAADLAKIKPVVPQYTEM
jgi:hypothetical protein